MKRSVAIFGPTPQFVRWAIDQPCPLRETDVDNLPDRTFQQLRCLREFSRGLIENRVFENICVHPASSSEDTTQARGFNADDVLDAVGDAASVQRCCQSCPANALSDSHPGTWAGCYGWLPATSGFSFDSFLRNGVNLNRLDEQLAYRPGRFDFVAILENVIQNLDLSRTRSVFTTTTPRWYGLWQNMILNCEQLNLLYEILESGTTQCLNEGAHPDEIADLILLRNALKRCIEHRLKFHVELIPPGISDGRTWTLAAHCPDCKFEMPPVGRQNCTACGRTGNPVGQRKSKVLGLRPYVNLVGVLGKQMTAEFMRRFDERTSK